MDRESGSTTEGTFGVVGTAPFNSTLAATPVDGASCSLLVPKLLALVTSAPPAVDPEIGLFDFVAAVAPTASSLARSLSADDASISRRFPQWNRHSGKYRRR